MPTTFTAMTDNDRHSYYRIMNRLRLLEFWFNHQFIENEDKRQDLAKEVEKKIDGIFRMGLEELGLNCSPLCPREGQCVPCDEL